MINFWFKKYMKYFSRKCAEFSNRLFMDNTFPYVIISDDLPFSSIIWPRYFAFSTVLINFSVPFTFATMNSLLSSDINSHLFGLILRFN